MFTPSTSESSNNDLKIYIASVTGNAEVRIKRSIFKILFTFILQNFILHFLQLGSETNPKDIDDPR